MISLMKCISPSRAYTIVVENSGLCRCKMKQRNILPTVINMKVIHTSTILSNAHHKKNDVETELTVQYFESQEEKQKKSYLEIIRAYIQHNPRSRGHIEFIKAGMKYMDEFGVNKDIECYKMLLSVLPKEKFVARNVFQAIFEHYPKQQQVIIDLLSKMEYNGVIPDYPMQAMLLERFGKHAHPVKKYWRMMYWMPKFKNINPWPLPQPPPDHPRDLARHVIKRMSSVDIQTEIHEFETKDIKDAIDHTWIISAMSPLQRTLLDMHDVKKPLNVEGPFTTWCKKDIINYFILKTDPIRTDYFIEDPDDISNIRIPFWDQKKIALPRTVHEQDDGTYLAMCATGTSSNDSVLSWVRCLQNMHPILSKMTIVFRLTTCTDDMDESTREALSKAINVKISDKSTDIATSIST